MWTELVHRSDHLNTVMNLQVSEQWISSRQAERLLASKEGFCFYRMNPTFRIWVSADWPDSGTTCSASHNASSAGSVTRSLGRRIEQGTGRSLGVRFHCFCECVGLLYEEGVKFI